MKKLFRAPVAIPEVLAGYINQRIDKQRMIVGGRTTSNALSSYLKIRKIPLDLYICKY